ncbi:MAG: MCE family protein [Cyanobacteria bacterium SIG26]|nr:MCE family protein [Cyanobacteria bacterium SIG26]
MKVMKSFGKIRVYAWIEFAIWLIIIAICVFGIRYHHYQAQKQFKNYQIFIDDADGLIVGSPVKFLGVQIGHIKKIQILSSDIYIKFVITQKDLVLPAGSIATVEASGLGGSKALEIYPPNSKNPTDKIIATKSPTRLSKVMGLFDSIFKELDSIIMTLTHASNQFEFTSTGSIPQNIVMPVESSKNLDGINQTLDTIIDNKKQFMKNFNKK